MISVFDLSRLVSKRSHYRTPRAQRERRRTFALNNDFEILPTLP